MEFFSRRERSQRVKVIFNPQSGALAAAPDRLQVLLAALQAAGRLPEVYLVEPEHDLRPVVKEALRRGHRRFVVCGGDGTIDSVAGALAGTRGALAIMPAGTRNNVAFSLGLPEEPAAVAQLVRAGHHRPIDVGLAECGGEQRVFLEACSVGLLSALFPATDELQHGHLEKLGDLLSTLIASPVSEMRLTVDGEPALHTQGHVLLAANMPVIGPRFRVAAHSALDDGLLDLVVYAELSKLDLLGSVIQSATGGSEDERIRRYQVRAAVVETSPPMPVVVDGFPFGAGGPLRLSVRRRALNILAPAGAPEPAEAGAAT